MVKKITTVMLSAIMCLSLCACSVKKNGANNNGTATPQVDRATMEIRQNDYRGGVKRSLALKDGIVSIMENMKQNNKVIREDNPNSYWTKEGYQEFVTNFLSDKIINDTQWFNEEEASWDGTLSAMLSEPNSFTTKSDKGYSKKNGVEITRIEKDEYSVTGLNGSISTGRETIYSGPLYYSILYDGDKDWCKAYVLLDTNVDEIGDVTAEFFEYARVNDDVYAIQTSRERLYVILDPVEADTDIRQRTIKEFYYSKLRDDVRTTFSPYEVLPEYVDDDNDPETPDVYDSDANKLNTTMDANPHANEKGDLDRLYGKNDSVFLGDVSRLMPEWVYEDKALLQAISYKDGTLVVTTYNKLSEKYERFIYTTENANSSDVSVLEGMVEIEQLGAQVIPKRKTPMQDLNPDDNSTTTEEDKEVKDKTTNDGTVEDASTVKTITDEEGNTTNATRTTTIDDESSENGSGTDAAAAE